MLVTWELTCELTCWEGGEGDGGGVTGHKADRPSVKHLSQLIIHKCNFFVVDLKIAIHQ